MQLGEEKRGFSFSKEGPLDMRMDPTATLTAKEVINSYSEEELRDIFFTLGEEPKSRKAAKAIVEARRKKPIETTKELVQVLVSAIGHSVRRGFHPATLIFQALRIFVNRELEAIEVALRKAIQLTSQGGALAVLSFHSLEDRIVKNIFRDAATKNRRREVVPILELLTKKPLTPSAEEIQTNPRSRSAKLRAAIRL